MQTSCVQHPIVTQRFHHGSATGACGMRNALLCHHVCIHRSQGSYRPLQHVGADQPASSKPIGLLADELREKRTRAVLDGVAPSDAAKLAVATHPTVSATKARSPAPSTAAIPAAGTTRATDAKLATAIAAAGRAAAVDAAAATSHAAEYTASQRATLSPDLRKRSALALEHVSAQMQDAEIAIRN